MTGARPLVEHAAAYDLGASGLVRATGRDTWTFLQSLLSQDVSALAPGSGAASLLLTPQGKLVVVLRVFADADGAWLDCEADFAEALREGLARYRIRVDVTLSAVPAARVVVRGVGAVATVHAALGVEVPSAPLGHVGWSGLASAPDEVALVVRADWSTAPGVDIVGPAAVVAAARDALASAGVPFVDHATYEASRIEAGVAVQGRDLDDKLIPQEAFLDRDAVSFTKGCFLGQELVCRIDTRGHVNRFLRRVEVDGVEVVPEGADVVASGNVVGMVTSVATVTGEDRTVALAMVRREIEPPADVVLRWNGTDHPARVVAIS